MKVFSKEKMIERVKSLGMEHMIDDDVMKIMENLDGCVCTTASWMRQIHDEPVLSCVGKDGKAYDVNENDVIDVYE